MTQPSDAERSPAPIERAAADGALGGPRLPHIGQVESVTGRGSDGSRTGARLRRMHLALDDVGGELEIEHRPPPDARTVKVEVLERLAAGSFALCPICMNAPADTSEHVPHGAMGGAAMTRTCRKCNNTLGSRLEPHLTAWLDDTFVDVRIKLPSLPGARKVKFTLRRTVEGPLIMFLEGPTDRISSVLERDGHGELVFTTPVEARYKIAALKHAYLAACLYLGGVPDSADAVGIREELMTARDVPRPRDIRCGPRAAALNLAKTYDAADGPSLALVRVLDREEDDQEFGIVLAASVLVPWPLDSHPLYTSVTVPPIIER